MLLFTHLHTHSLTHTLTHTLTHSHTYSLTHSLTHTHLLTHTHTHTHTLTHSLYLSRPLSPSLPLSNCRWRNRARRAVQQGDYDLHDFLEQNPVMQCAVDTETAAAVTCAGAQPPECPLSLLAFTHSLAYLILFRASFCSHPWKRPTSRAAVHCHSRHTIP